VRENLSQYYNQSPR